MLAAFLPVVALSTFLIFFPDLQKVVREKLVFLVLNRWTWESKSCTVQIAKNSPLFLHARGGSTCRPVGNKFFQESADKTRLKPLVC